VPPEYSIHLRFGLRRDGGSLTYSVGIEGCGVLRYAVAPGIWPIHAKCSHDDRGPQSICNAAAWFKPRGDSDETTTAWRFDLALSTKDMSVRECM